MIGWTVVPAHETCDHYANDGTTCLRCGAVRLPERIIVTRESEWQGNGFGTVTRHTARVGDRVIGEFRSGSSSNWAGDAGPILCMTYAGWRAQLDAFTRGKS